MDSRAWRAAVQRVTNEELDTNDHACVHAHTHTHRAELKFGRTVLIRREYCSQKSKKCWILKTEFTAYTILM